jgi:hypothetical protein
MHLAFVCAKLPVEFFRGLVFKGKPAALPKTDQIKSAGAEMPVFLGR